MRNVAFSIMLGALALLQIAVVAGELSHAPAQKNAAAVNHEVATRYVMASHDDLRRVGDATLRR